MSFKYNSDGIRTSKTVVDTSASEDYTVKYVLDGSKILRETHIDNTTNAVIRTLDFFYDDTGVSGFTLNGTPYYYIKNLQGDVIHICSASGGIAATYVYDAWGYVVSTTAGVGQINPFRYRGYYYDSESELYYLNSRYYDPQVGRFINADGIIGANGGLQGYNMFAYCNNNPVIYSDASGYTANYALDLFSDNNGEGELLGPTGGGSGYYFSFGNATYSSVCNGGIYNGGGSFGYTSSGIKSSFCAGQNTAAYDEAYINSSYNINSTPSYNDSLTITPDSVTTNNVHGNSKKSTKSQHLYAIYYMDTGEVAKIGISGKPLNLNGTSGRANNQVNSWNRDAGTFTYDSAVLLKDIPGRSAALELERIYADYFRNEGHRMDRHRRP